MACMTVCPGADPQLYRPRPELAGFVEHTLRTPLHFAPGTQYEYSSMGIMLAAEVGRTISKVPIKEFVADRVLSKLKMERSAIGVSATPCQSLAVYRARSVN